MRIPDPIELAESRVERWTDKNVIGDHFICGCGQLCKLDEGIALSPNPYCMPVCPDCAMQDPTYVRWVSRNEPGRKP